MRTVLLAAGTILLAGCGEPDPVLDDAADAVVRQSVERTPLDLQLRWQIGAAGGEVELFRPSAALVDEEGRTFVVDRGNHRILIVGPEGEVVHEFGREGEGPGEFSGIFGVALARDTLVVNDNGRRVHYFTSDGGTVATRSYAFPHPDANRLGLVGATPDGWVVSGSGYFRESEGDDGLLPPLMREHFFAATPDGSLTPHALQWEHELVGEYVEIFWIDPILRHQPSVGLDAQGFLLVADTASYRIDRYAIETGERVLRIENEVPLQEIDADLLEMWEETARCDPGNSECMPRMHTVRRGLERTTHRPIIQRLRVYPTGHFAVQRRDIDPNPFDSDTFSEYDFFDSAGVYLGSTSDLVPLWFDGLGMVTLERDELGIESVSYHQVGGGELR